MVHKSQYTVVISQQIEATDEQVKWFMDNQCQRRENMIAKGLTPKWELSTYEQAVLLVLENNWQDYLSDCRPAEAGQTTRSEITVE
jgi:hypothetical protein